MEAKYRGLKEEIIICPKRSLDSLLLKTSLKSLKPQKTGESEPPIRLPQMLV